MNDESQSPTLSSAYRPLRVWPPVLLIVVGFLLRIIHKVWEDGPANLWMASAFGPLLCSVLAVFWWLILSRAQWKERLFGLFGIAAAIAGSLALADESMIMPGSTVLTVPLCLLGFCAGAILFSRLLSFKRTLLAVLLCIPAAGYTTLLKSDGLWGDFNMHAEWRWIETAEEKLLAEKASQQPVAITAAEADVAAALANPEWPSFRGADRSGRQRGVQFSSDWKTNPPQELWRIGVGPAWSSFVVAGNLLFTQEQRGEEELTVCYNAATGQEIWSQGVNARFFEGLGGLGPRATPTLHNGHLYVMGAAGDLLKLDAQSGDILWQTNLKSVGAENPPMWGYCSSPLVVDSVVIVHVGGEADQKTQEAQKGTVAFDTETGELKWSVPSGMHSYSSPQLASIHGEPCVLMLSNRGVEIITPATGETQFAYEWKINGYRAVQPQAVGDDSFLLGTGMGYGTRRIRVVPGESGLKSEELWTSMALKPDFNDFVIHNHHAYGFDGSIFTCIDLETGERNWKRGRYGKGQTLLLEDSDLILVVTEKGKLVLLSANPDQHDELAELQALDGKTWNHPAVVNDRLFVRNANEAVCYQLPTISAANSAAAASE